MDDIKTVQCLFLSLFEGIVQNFGMSGRLMSNFDKIDKIKEISLQPFSCGTFAMARQTFQTIQKRYPSWGPVCPIPPVQAHWVGYAEDRALANFSLIADLEGHLDETIISKYLAMLRSLDRSIHIENPRVLQRDTGIIPNEGEDYPRVIPMQLEDHWAFAVAYTDCTHFYDSSENSEVALSRLNSPKPIVVGWTGPKQSSPEDSGILMLIGIRCLVQGYPHVDQDVADALASTFRVRMFVEICCQRIDPSKEHFERLLARNDPLENRDESPTHETDVLSDAGSSAHAPRHTEQASQTHALSSDRRAYESSICSSPHTSSQLPGGLLAGSPRASTSLGDRRLILRHLSEAVLTNRSVRTTMTIDFATLWQIVRRGSMKSEFYQRYYAVLFSEKMEALRNQTHQELGDRIGFPHRLGPRRLQEMKSKQRECSFWKSVCDLRREWGDTKYVLLCAVSNHRSRDHQDTLSELRSRLQDENDELESMLDQARALCGAIIQDSLPAQRLMVDNYQDNDAKNIDNNLYGAFVSLDPRVRVPLTPSERS